MQKKIVLLFAVSLLSLADISFGQKCNECMSNGVLCDSPTSYVLCDGGIPMGKSKSCSGDKKCTNSDAICESEADIDSKKLVIPCEGSCAICPDSSAAHTGFTCVSQKEYVRCVDQVPVYSAIFECDTDEECSNDIYQKDQNICAPECVLDHYGMTESCTNPAYVAPTEPPPTTTSSPAQLQAVCAAVQTTKTYFYTTNTNDLTCRAYVYCELRNNAWTAIGMACPEGYFSEVQQKCVTGEKPSTCPVAQVTTLRPDDGINYNIIFS
ncbi:uncharacterized protein LOC119669413 [Teleopsis dalmanni]|uniref:uncharacterized protein LOC119669413 n=1 Tax=Teleopsis dalmanni TaxID=139649 RepID=UPI0018CF9E60|nr:uncharacterized protein LOC119669413 [Teleopsis dalmanni]